MKRFRDGFFTRNRKRLAAAFPEHLLVIPAHSAVQYSADQAFPFRQDSSFWYLTGINEPDMLLVVDTDSGESTLLTPSESDYKAKWDGVVNESDLKKVSGIDSILQRSGLCKILSNAKTRGLKVSYLKPLDVIVEPYGFYSNPSRRKLEQELLEDGPLERKDLVDIRQDIARLRMVKQPEEIAAIQNAIDVTAETLAAAKDKLGEFKTEKELERAISAGFYAHGGDGHAYEPIIAGGINAATLHYTANCKRIANSELLLLDVGAQVDGYAADISRTWIVGKPSERQREVFDAVVGLQQKAFDMLKPGILLADYQKALENEAEKIFVKLKCSMAGKQFPHGFSHFLGLDVHDAGDYNAPLVENSVITVEPGIYLPDEGIGVRIEDNVLITKTGIKNLSESIPREL